MALSDEIKRLIKVLDILRINKVQKIIISKHLASTTSHMKLQNFSMCIVVCNS